MGEIRDNSIVSLEDKFRPKQIWLAWIFQTQKSTIAVQKSNSSKTTIWSQYDLFLNYDHSLRENIKACLLPYQAYHIYVRLVADTAMSACIKRISFDLKYVWTSHLQGQSLYWTIDPETNGAA